jgi:polysaccharide biosynthesis/export protein
MMNRSDGAQKAVVAGCLTLALCVAAFAREDKEKQDPGVITLPSQSGQTGAGWGEAGMAAAKSGQADDVGNLRLGGRRPLYRLNRTDIVALSFTLSPEFDQILTIQPDGYVALRDAGLLLARGLTLEEFREAVRLAYTGYLHDPQVAVALKEFEHPYFVAGGEVAKPGRYELRTDISVIEAVEIAGGFTHEAKHSQVLLFRRVNDDLMEAHALNLKRLLKERRGEFIQLRPGDLIFVPQNSISKIQPFLSKASLGMYVNSAQF